MRVIHENVNMVLSHKILFFSIFLLVLPVDIMQVSDEQSGLPICLLLLPFGILFFLKQNIVLDKFYFWLTFVLCLVSIIAVSILYNTFPFKSSLSLVYFLLPNLGYFLALGLVKNIGDFIMFLKITVLVAFILSVSLFYSIFILNEGVVRTEGVLSGTFFGLKLSGAYGVHSLGAHYFILINFIFFYLEIVKEKTKFMFCISVFSILTLTYIIILSLSRELVLAIVLFYLIYFLIKYKPIKTFIVIGSLCLIVLVFGKGLIDTVVTAWEYKLYASSSSTSLNELSSGRLDLQELALTQIIDNPLFSTGFNGYTLNHSSYKDYDNLEGWSTHVYLLTCLWKMGLLAFISYLLFWKNILKQMFQNDFSDCEIIKKMLVLFVVNILFVNLFWDALLAPNIMALFSFFCGCFVSIKNSEKSINNPLGIINKT
ncbi:O-antigen ligase family protein [Flavobacterium psychrophilum]|uniref:O-antigen ligase family protein n=1 Tax=Flavobacterium psychrophilum TaxID=96345 RepID=UPI001C8F863F|nr:O-antigen ligase family protein [Flavobacterium psychrophilum]EKT4498077.1 O-antigen ligase family protein [Flavobacterium psychrophilum]EKT4570167.1 O-antigen ligase family protein [Flavobacterium psychrophilum]ELM3649341.1 O-antigen ligase family protein [Flavobacterium psychrophilum]ELM3670187.1 O-antigen ligase family protein [Flavobacterium psychrophilum]ELM3724901.1 O-antigen ligase family protein [Flavobacterium psychrophilum]